MKARSDIGLTEVKAVYDGAEGDLWELIMGHQIHIGGLNASLDLAERAAIGSGMKGIDLCCCNGAGMRALVRFRDVASMTGVDATATVIERGKTRTADEGLADRVHFVRADACATGLPAGSADFVWAEDAWCYVEDKRGLVCEATRLVRPGGTVAFTDWLEGPAGLTSAEADRFLGFMKFPTLEDMLGYGALLERNGCSVHVAEDSGRFPAYMDLYMNMIEMQLTYDALRIIGFDMKLMETLAGEMSFLRDLAHAEKVVQGRFIARKR
jgi:ubiquinone/menaquinone biosynthesis C-methylase UbiE